MNIFDTTSTKPIDFSPSDTIESLNEVLVENEEEKCNYSLGELLALPKNEVPYLLEGIIQSGIIGFVVGAPDSGKSMFLRNLALAIISGDDNFVGFQLHTKHKRAIYVSTEDGKEQTKFAFEKLLSDRVRFENEYKERLNIIFADTLTKDEIIGKLTPILEENPVDLVILDGYGDIFDGSDGNSNMAVRQFLKPFSGLAYKYNCVVLFIHHTNKNGYDSTPNQRHAQGAGSIGQKARLMLEIRTKDVLSELRYLLVLKGNGVSRELKAKGFEMIFSEENFTFKSTDNICPLKEFEKRPSTKNDSDDYATLFQNEEKAARYKDLVQRAEEKFAVSVPTAKRGIKEQLGHWKQADGSYLNPQYQVSTP